MDLIENKYHKWYFSLMKLRISSIPEGYSERHHIIPKSLGGSNDASNVVRLTAREHFIAHLLLVKMTSDQDRKKMLWALHRMAFSKVEQRKLHSHEYDIARRLHSDNMREKKSDATRLKMSINNVGFRGKKHSPETRKRQSVALKGRKLERDVSGANNPFYGKHHSPETKALISKNHSHSRPWLGKHLSEETKKKISETKKRKKLGSHF